MAGLRVEPDSPTVRRRAGGYRRRMGESRRAGRRRTALRALVIILVIVGIGAGAFLLIPGMRGPRDAEGSGGTVTSMPPVVSDGTTSALLRIDGPEGGQVFLLLSAGDERLILALPAETLVSGEEGLRPLAALLAESGFAAGAAALERLLGIEPEVFVSAPAVLLEETLEAVGGAELRLPLNVESEAVEEVSAAVAVAEALAAAAADPAGQRTLKSMQLTGDVEALVQVLTALSSGNYASGVVPGSFAEGMEFDYFEPDLAATAALLGRPLAPVGVTVEVHNGSGLIGIAEKVAALVSPLGFRVLPVRNAEQFPNVESTQLLSAPDVLSQAGRIRDLLGRGMVVRREDLPAGRIVVIVGKDVVPENLPSASVSVSAGVGSRREGRV